MSTRMKLEPVCLILNIHVKGRFSTELASELVENVVECRTTARKNL